MDPGIKIWPLPQRIRTSRDRLMNHPPTLSLTHTHTHLHTHTHTHTHLHITPKVQRKRNVWIKVLKRVTRESLLFLTDRRRMKDRWKCRNDGKRGRKRNTQAAHKHSGVAVSGTRVRVGRGFSSLFKNLLTGSEN